ncbi:hypothetical protein NDU88_011271 [Pleurodeles waltl]|uniref:Uncharacterized protein n=1 Tax=Pleurodeles waltl TaxID=8319 RepID=A0AAV7R155_PLEWA|nr:hypothetical protein NDU88_011271 [Pleurodeles waltl]
MRATRAPCRAGLSMGEGAGELRVTESEPRRPRNLLGLRTDPLRMCGGAEPHPRNLGLQGCRVEGSGTSGKTALLDWSTLEARSFGGGHPLRRCNKGAASGECSGSGRAPEEQPMHTCIHLGPFWPAANLQILGETRETRESDERLEVRR